VARYHTRARQPLHSAAAVEIELRHWHGLPARCSDTIRNESERALGHRPNKSRPVAARRDRTRVAHIPSIVRRTGTSARLRLTRI
jgi:hypothetical protein